MNKKKKNEPTVKWLKTLETATLTQLPTPVNQHSKENNQMPLLESNRCQKPVPSDQTNARGR